MISGIFSSQKLGGFVIDAEALAPSPALLSGLGAPRPYIGMDLPVSDDPIDMFYTGLNWDAYFGSRFYLGFSLGGAVASKRKVTNHLGNTKDLGSSVLFHLQASAGYDLTPNMTVQVYYNHFSNARLARPDPGLEFGRRPRWLSLLDRIMVQPDRTVEKRMPSWLEGGTTTALLSGTKARRGGRPSSRSSQGGGRPLVWTAA